MLVEIKNAHEISCPRCGFGVDHKQDIDFLGNNVIIRVSKDSRKTNMDIIVENYYHRRFNMMLKPALKSIGERFPSVNDIISILYEKKETPANNLCPCPDKDTHYIRHLYKVVLKGQGVPLYLGERCFINHGYPLSLCRALEKIRRIIQNDVEHIRPLSDDEVVAAKDSTRATADVILQNEYSPGLLFLRDFGSIINDLLSNKISLPPWLTYMLGTLARESIANLPHVQQQRKEKNRLTYQKQYDFLMRIDAIVHGRSEFVRDMLSCIDSGEGFTPQQENAIAAMMKKYDEVLLYKTEEALPFLVALNNGKIVLSDQDATVFPGQTYSIFQSMLRQVAKGNALSTKQVELLRNKYKAYKTQYLSLSLREKMSTAELLQACMIADKNKDLIVKQEIVDILTARGIPAQRINLALESCLT